MIKAKEGRLIFDRDRSPTENVSPSHENVAVRIISNPSQRSNLIRRDPFLSTRPSHEQPQYDIANIILGYFPQNYVGTLLEVGSAHPVCISVSLPFRNLGWKIISVEPIPEFCEEFKKRNFKILEYAASGEDIGPTTFKVSPDLVCSSSLSIKSEVEAIHFAAFGWTEKNFKSITVQAFTLNTILQRHCPEVAHIDAMIVDTEGWELEVMKGFDLIRFNPKVVCLENFQGKISYRQYMKAKGYEFDTKEIQDEFFLKVSEGQIS